ncbi:hypothetical protein BB559_005987 [Furculomyces boomerangus]|uniref:Deoxyhypusine hydroxylase n=1 Tax=Furculomyces boomerangus TaxID=61424 RepID=A0A2T9Y5B9_9FUNG|nr:hypothetical protein BB559_005987 [Furculomyces boomerangus]
MCGESKVYTTHQTENSALSELQSIILNEKNNVPLFQRYRALFSLKGLGTEEAVDIIIKSIKAEKDSELFKHELAYCLGQLQNKKAIPVLIDLIKDPNEFVMVRHEAAESIGAISESETIEILKDYLNDPCKELADTCLLAIEKIKYDHSEESKKVDQGVNIYGSIDPTPATTETKDISELKNILCDQKRDLWSRYRAMFALRDINNDEAVEALSEALESDKTSALFRHEIGFVFGEMQHPKSAHVLKRVLGNATEAPMVRHEAAEALGSIASDEVFSVLKEYLNDRNDVIRESCEVALDMYEYENSNEFQYAIIPDTTSV